MTRISIAMLGLLAVCAVPSSSRAQDVPEWAQEDLAAWYQAYNTGDAAAVAAHYAADAVRFPLQGGPIIGRAAIEASLEGEFALVDIECSGDFDSFHQVGDLATGTGLDECAVTPRSGAASQRVKVRWLVLYGRQADGSWLTVRESLEAAE